LVRTLIFCGDSDELVSDWFFEAKLKSVATVIPKYPKISCFIAGHRAREEC